MYWRQSMISFMISMCAHVWYHTQRKCYDFMIWMLLYHVQKSYYIKCTWNIYDIMTKGVISYMITDMISSFCFIWYWVYLWYHTFSYDIITISYTWYYAWYCSMILRDRFHDIFFANYIVNKTIWCYVYLKIRWYHKKVYDICHSWWSWWNGTLASFSTSATWSRTYV